MRLRQVVVVAADIVATEARIERELGLELCHRDPGVATFGVRNALFPIGDKLLEVVSPTQPGTAAGRLLDKRGGDSGYMVMLEVDDLESLRERFADHDARVVYEAVADGIVGLHLHPADVGGAILSVDRAATWGEWPWAGPAWRDHVRRERVDDVLAVIIEAAAPRSMAERWAALLDREVDDDTVVLDEGEIRFVPSGGRGEGVAGFVLRSSSPASIGVAHIAGCRFELVGS